MPILIRLAQPQDAPALMRLNEAFNGPGGQTAGSIEASLRLPGPERVLVAESVETKELAGFCCCFIKHSFCYEVPSAEITEFYVSPAWRRQRIGRRLLQAALQLCKDCGAVEITLLTGSGNYPAQALYKSAGFSQSGEIHMEWEP